VTQYLLYCLVGKLLIYLGQNFAHLQDSKVKFISDLFSCDLCLGVWIMTLLSWGTSTYLFSDIFNSYSWIMGVVTGCVTSFILHLVTIGWKEKFSIIIV
jgi:hypothetical protein